MNRALLLVALRKESVDRNLSVRRHVKATTLDLSNEGVDRNVYGCLLLQLIGVSLSARRAWIEM